MAELAAPAFLGPPGRLRWAREGADEPGTPTAVHLPESLAAYADPRHPPLRASRRPGRLRIRLAPQTPPGVYQVGVEYADGRREEVAVAVEPRPRLHVAPGTLRFAAAAGAPASARLLLENRGNEPLAIAESLVSGLFDNGGIEAALAAVYRLDSDDISQIVSAGFARLREAHGGLLKLRVCEGAGVLAPGERRQLRLDTTLPGKLAAGHGYHGTVELGPHRIAVQVSVA